MKIQMEKKVFYSLPINAIGHACFEPMVPVYQEGMREWSSQITQEYRTKFYSSLSEGQRALWGIFSFYDHAIKSNDEFQRISKHYLSQQIFGIVKRGAEYFNDNDMCQLLLRIEQTISANDKNETIGAILDGLYQRLCEIAPHTLTRIGVCIKDNPTEFICFE